MGIETDFAIDDTNKRVYHNTGTTVYSANALYSWLMDTFDELNQMDDPVPMSAQTPTSYTMVNEWFIDDESVKYLKEGAISTSGYTNKIQLVTLISSGYDNCIPADIGKMVTDDGGDTGKLLAYNNTTRKWWVRWATTIGANSVMDIPTGAGGGTSVNASSVSGEDLFANVYTLGTIESAPYPQVYIFQAGVGIAEWSNLTNWDRGQIDVLIKVKEFGTFIDGANITVFARQSGDLYDNFAIDLSGGGRNAVPLSTADDLNEDTGEYYLLYDAESTAFTTIGQIITGVTSTATAELVAATDWGTSGVLTLRGKKGTFQDNETITGSTEGSATVNGTVGDTYITYDVEGGTPPGVGTTMVGGTSAAKRILRGIQDDGTAGKLVLQVDTTQTGANRTAYYKTFQDNEQIQQSGTPANYYYSSSASVTIVSGWSDITVAFVNGTATYSTHSGTGINGERVTFTGGEGILLLDDTPGTATGTVTLGNMTITAIDTLVITGDKSGAVWTATQNLQSAHMMNKNFEQQSTYPYDVIINAGDIYQAGRTLAQVYEYFKFITQENSTFSMYTVVSSVITVLDGEEYIIAYSGYVPSKAAPLGTFAGGKYFGAQSVWIEGMASGQSYQFTDSNGVIRTPYASISIKVTSIISGDRVAVFRTSAGTINKALYTSTADVNASTNTVFRTTSTLSVDTPSNGVFRAVDTSATAEYRYPYSSWSGTVITLTSGTLGVNYDATDTIYVPFIDKEATTTYAEQIVLYSADRDVLLRVRNKTGTMLPFETSGVVGSAGLTVAAIRTADGIVT